MLHECLTGGQPYPGDSVSVVIAAHLMQPVPKPSEERPGIPAAFDEVIAKGMAKKPEDRFVSAGDLAIAANDALSERDQDQAATILQRSQDATMPGTGALATVDCGEPSTPGGPANARYSLFADQAILDSHFDVAIKKNSELFQCPGSGFDSPTTWHYTDTPDEVEGRIACGTYNNGPDLVWSKNSDRLLADAQGPNMDDLHKWWLKYG